MTTRFECRMCGNCCRNLRGRGSLWPGSLPDFVYVSVPHSHQTISLQEWEVSTLREKAKKLSVAFKVEPNFLFLDEISGGPIVTQWNLDHDDCPFLSAENKCLVNEEKPLICQAYPLLVIELFNDMDEPKNLAIGDCPNAVELPFKDVPSNEIKPAEFFRQLFDKYHAAFLGNMNLASTATLLRNTMSYLIGNGLIRPAPIHKKGVMKALLRGEQRGLLEHLRDRYPDVWQKVSEEIQIIKQFDLKALEDLINESTSRNSA